MNTILAIAAGGAIGSVLRYITSSKIMQVLGSGFPYGTFSVNLIGSFLMGILIGLLAKYFAGNQTIHAFLTVGLLGGFTTFSAFSLDTLVLLQRGDFLIAAAYILSSVILSVAGLWFGLSIMRIILS
mgnify:CR=1 FL=1